MNAHVIYVRLSYDNFSIYAEKIRELYAILTLSFYVKEITMFAIQWWLPSDLCTDLL